MPLVNGARLGPYEVLAPLGSDSLDRRMMAVPVSTGTTFEFGAAVPLFEARTLVGPINPLNPAGFRAQYDVARDGRWLLNVPLEDANASPITVVLNWAAGLRGNQEFGIMN